MNQSAPPQTCCMARPRLITPELKDLALELADLGYSRREIAEGLGVSAVTLRREVARDQSFAQRLRQVQETHSGERRLGAAGRVLWRMLLSELRAAIERRDAA